MDHLTVPLTDFAEDLIGDGIIDAQEVTKIRERIYADGVIDREEADFLFTVNDGVSGNDNHPTWKPLFVDALTAHLLEDDISPGEIDKDEEGWLVGKIQGDGQVDDCEKALLLNIQTKAKTFPNSLAELL